MATATLPNRIDAALDRFQVAREGARRHQEAVIGKDIDSQRCFADWLLKVKSNDRKGLEPYYAKSAMNEVSGTTGGYLVPVELRDDLMQDISTDSLFRRFGATVIPMESAELDLPLPDVQTPQPAGTAPYFGGIKLTWSTGGEGAKLGETAEPKFRNVKLRSWYLSGYAFASNPFLQDALAVEKWLKRLFGSSVAWYTDYAYFQGSGVGQPTGVINANASATRNRAVANQISVADAQNMIDNLLPSSWERAVWFAHPTALTQITAFTGWFPNGPLMLYGLPVVPTGQCSTLGSRGDLVLADPSLYVIGDRMELEVAYSPHEPTAMLNNQSAWRVAYRGDGQPWTGAPIDLPDGTSQVSPYVVLN